MRASLIILGFLAVLAVGLGPTGCTTHVLNANLTRAKLEGRIGENFQKGMSYGDVNAKLSQLGVREGVRRTYAPVPPREMLVRLLPPGGIWLDENPQTVEWWDVTFSFDGEDKLNAARAFNGSARYIDGWVSDANPPLPPGLHIHYPQPIPPPEPPPQGDPIPLGP